MKLVRSEARLCRGLLILNSTQAGGFQIHKDGQFPSFHLLHYFAPDEMPCRTTIYEKIKVELF